MSKISVPKISMGKHLICVRKIVEVSLLVASAHVI